MSEVRADWGYTAVGATSRRPAYALAAVLVLGLAGLAIVVSLPSNIPQTYAPVSAIGGGPRAEVAEQPLGADCETSEGAPYEADQCVNE